MRVIYTVYQQIHDTNPSWYKHNVKQQLWDNFFSSRVQTVCNQDKRLEIRERSLPNNILKIKCVFLSRETERADL